MNRLIFILKKENSIKIFGNNSPKRMDALIGFHRLIQNGLVTEDYLSFSYANFEDKKHSIIAGTSKSENNPNALRTAGSHKGKSIEMTI